ncbi:hypothetical protein QYF36_015509 [Acer negundo]|nr:hypothetical protein QYF36_015509 [Acer negundo]
MKCSIAKTVSSNMYRLTIPGACGDEYADGPVDCGCVKVMILAMQVDVIMVVQPTNHHECLLGASNMSRRYRPTLYFLCLVHCVLGDHPLRLHCVLPHHDAPTDLLFVESRRTYLVDLKLNDLRKGKDHAMFKIMEICQLLVESCCRDSSRNARRVTARQDFQIKASLNYYV